MRLKNLFHVLSQMLALVLIAVMPAELNAQNFPVVVHTIDSQPGSLQPAGLTPGNASPGSTNAAALKDSPLPVSSKRGMATQAPLAVGAARREAILNAVNKRPISFIAADDQADAFVARNAKSLIETDARGLSIETLEVQKPAAVRPEASDGGMPWRSATPVKFTRHSVRIDLEDANAHARATGLEAQSERTNLLLGSDPAKWRRNVVSYDRVRYAEVYPGIDLTYYGRSSQELEYDFVVAPKADPSQIRLRVSGDALLDSDGNLRVASGKGDKGDVALSRPVLYQDVNNGKKAITGKFVQIARNEFAFGVGEYDHSKPLVIDPEITVVYATYMGGIHDDEANGLVLDATGAAYVSGYTASQDFPVSGNAYQTTRMNIGTYTYDAFVMKFDVSGNLIFSTYLGGSNTDQARAVQVDPSGNVYLAGYTTSSDFPVTTGAYQTMYGGGSDAFLAKFSNDGSQLLYSTYLGGSGDEAINRLVLNADGSFWAAGDASADGLPVSATAVQQKVNGTDDGFVAKFTFNASGALQIPYLTFLGGSNSTGEEGLISSLDVDSSGNVYVTGGNQSGDFPVSANAYEKPFPLSGGCYDSPTPNQTIFITKFSPDLSKMLYSTVVGGKTEDQNGYPVCNQYGETIHVDAAGNMWVIGSSGMSDFPTTANAISKTLNGNGGAGIDNVVFELSADGSKELYGTYLGGSQFDYGGAAVWDASGDIWMSGPTQSPDFPVTANALQPANAGGYDTEVTELSPDGSKILYSTYLGGSGDEDVNAGNKIALDAQGNVHLVGETNSTNYPVTPTALQAVYANGDQGPDRADAYYTILGTGLIGSVGPSVGGNTGDSSLTVTGAGFQSGATCSLVDGGTTIASVQATVNSSGTSITCSFALNGAATGSYSVVVNNPDGSSFTKSAAYTIESGGQPKIWVDIVGRAKIRTGTPGTFYVTYGNSGNTDAYFVPVSITFPANLTFDFTGGLKSQDTTDTTDYSNAAIYQQSGTSFIPLIIPVVRAGTGGSISFQVTSPTDESFGITVDSNPAWYDSLTTAQNELTAALANPTAVGTTCTQDASKPYLNDCLGQYVSQNAQTILTTPSSLIEGSTTLPATPPGITAASAATAVLQSLTDSLQLAQQPATALDRGADQHVSKTGLQPRITLGQGIAIGIGVIVVGGAIIWWNLTHPAPPSCEIQQYVGSPYICTPQGSDPSNCQNYTCQDVYCADSNTYATKLVGYSYIPGCQPSNYRCLTKGSFRLHRASLNLFPFDAGAGSGGGGSSSGGSCSGSGSSIDPNYKAGPSGDGSSSQYVNGFTPLHYVVGFENDPTATLPAAQVVVTDQLDPTKVNLSTLTLGSITIGATNISLPQGTNSYNTTYKLSSTISVRISGSVDTTTGLLKFTFTTIDPTTNLPPTDPTVGFLPPDTNGIVGQGAVTFNVMPVSTIPTGTAVNNTASVVFDTNAAIQTQTWTNTLDVDAPDSSVTALEPEELASFPVSWAGTDKGSGIATYTVYVSDNGGAFTPWQTAVTTTTATYAGTVGHSYGFYSIATDAAGNVEAPKTTADTTTMVVTKIAPLTTTTALTASTTTATPGQSVTLTAKVAGPSNTGTLPSGSVTFLSGTTSLGMGTLDATGTATLATTKLPTGSDTITAQYGGDTYFATSTSSAVTIVVAAPSFTLSVSPTSLTVEHGSTGSTTVSLAPVGGFTGQVTFACSGLPANSTCSFSPGTVTPSGSGAATTTITIATDVNATSLAVPHKKPGSGRQSEELALGLLLGLGGLVGARRRWGRYMQAAAMILFAAGLTLGTFAMTGCGGGSNNSGGSGPITPSGTSTITVTGTSGTISQTATFKLTVE